MFSLAFRSVRQISLAASSFSRLQIGDLAIFSLLIEAADSVQLGEGLCKGCEQSSGWLFSLQDKRASPAAPLQLRAEPSARLIQAFLCAFTALRDGYSTCPPSQFD